MLLPAWVVARQHLPDSTVRALKLVSNDSSRYALNHNAALYFQEINKDSSLFYNEKCLFLAENNNLKLITARVLANKGYLLIGKAKYAEALNSLLQAFAIAENPQNASKRWFTNQKLTPEQSRLFVLALTHHMYGILMKATQNATQEVVHFKEARRIALLIPDKTRVMLAAMNLGEVYQVLNKTDSALVLLNEAKKLALETGQKGYFSVILAGFGDIALKKGDKAKAKSLYYEGISSATATNNNVAAMRLYTTLATLYLAEKNRDSSLYFAQKMLQTSVTLGMRSSVTANIGIAYEKLYESYKLRGQLDSAYKYSRLALAENDSINNTRVENLARFQSLSLKEQLRLQNLEKQKVLYQSRVRIYALLAGLFFFIAIGIILWRNNRKQKRTNQLLSEQKEEISVQRDNLEHQNHELEIEAALERVRSRTMAMQRSEELSEVAFVLFQQFKELGENPDQATIGIFNQTERVIEYWVTMHGNQNNKLYKFSIDEPNVTSKIYEAWKAHKSSLVIDLSGKPLFDFMEYRASMGGAAVNPDEKRRIINVALFSKGLINVQSTIERSEESIRLLERFARVFEQTYTRFLDLQKAESQGRESQIQLALERVRARTMAMQRSEELHEVIQMVFDQLEELNFKIDNANFILNYRETDDLDLWLAVSNAHYPTKIRIPYIEHPLFDRFNKAKEKGGFYADTLSLEEKNSFFGYFFKHVSDVSDERKALIFSQPGFARSVVFMKNTALTINNYQGIPYSEADNNTLLRFGQVFDETYTRFSDLKQAEAQAREAQIEAALERVRSRTMGMQKSAELTEIASLLFKQVNDLGIKTWTTGFNVWSDDNNSFVDYITSPQGGFIEPYTVYAPETKLAKEVSDARKNGDEFLVQYAEGEVLKETYLALTKLAKNKQYEKMLEGGFQFPSKQVDHFVFGSKVSLMFITYEPVPEAHDIFKRFGKVFEQTYTRFLDLQKAEAQVREAQIEAALERVRSRTMAMHSSQDVADTSVTMFQELVKLGVESTVRCGVAIISSVNDLEVWTASLKENGSITLDIGRLAMTAHPLLMQVFSAWQKKELSTTYELTGDAVRSYFQALNDAPGYPFKYQMDSLPEKWGINAFFFAEGCLFAFTGEPLSLEMSQMFKRFAGVFGQTYTRFLDLQKAEARAREAQVEAALERVRSCTLAMQKSDELAETAAVLFRQMISLGIEPNRLYIGITKENTSEIEFWITDEDGSKVSNMFTGDADKNISMKKMHNAWKTHQKSIIIDMQGDELTEYLHYLGEILHVPFKGGLAQKRRVTYISYFSNGFIGMASPGDQPQETIDLLDRFAYVFNLTYARFNDLKIAELHAIQAEQDLIAIKAARKNAEDALADLRAAQKQLIQSEKMASLGELTAGIAHEIQNPLNFVNNFSEVSAELIDEMAEKLDKGDIEEVKAIAGDIKDNLDKIRHHGKRADGIVKAMLQHSRTSSGQKEPTDLNALADEYLRLSYHGLRAKDKSFNAELATHFDKRLPKVTVIPQDMGRVILNLINNAFYATQQKQKTAGPDYKPLVEVKTQLSGDQVSIYVKDNGVGIPDTIKDKIMQPFFTTKPTSEGTGLGLSLSYDIVVKTHEGNILINSLEGNGSEFIINLPLKS